MNFISDFADQAVLLPLAAITPVVLGVLGWRRAALAWVLAVGGAFGSVLLLKAGLIMMTDAFGSAYRASPSGHVAASCVVYGGLAALLLRGLMPGWFIAVFPALVIAVVGYTRIALGAHTLPEVAAGALIGAVALSAMVAMAGERPRTAAWPIMITAGGLAFALHGFHLPAEAAIQMASSGW